MSSTVDVFRLENFDDSSSKITASLATLGAIPPCIACGKPGKQIASLQRKDELGNPLPRKYVVGSCGRCSKADLLLGIARLLERANHNEVEL